MRAPEPVRFAVSGDVSIAYQAMGEGPPDIIVMPGLYSHLEVAWEFEPYRAFHERLAAFARVIRLDKRGTGMSDRVTAGALPTLEERTDDIRAVLDAEEIERATILGVSDGGTMAAFFAATFPDRTAALILYGAEAFNPDEFNEAELAQTTERIRREWGTPASARRSLEVNAPSMIGEPEWLAWVQRHQRFSASPGAVMSMVRMNAELDVRHVMGAIRVPTLILHRINDLVVDISHGRILADAIGGAKLVELTGTDHFPWAGDQAQIIDEIEEFLTGVRDPAGRNRVLATVVFTDIVGSTELAAELGDAAWRELLARHHAVVRRDLDRFRGHEIDTAGDGFLASFDGPARAVRFARHAVEELQAAGVAVRAGIHTGECEIYDGKLAGVAVHIGARIANLAAAGEVLVSGTVRDLVAGSGLRFDDRGEQILRGLPEPRRIFAVAD